MNKWYLSSNPSLFFCDFLHFGGKEMEVGMIQMGLSWKKQAQVATL